MTRVRPDVTSKRLRAVGVAAFVVGLAGFVALGWRFDAAGGSPVAVAAAAVAAGLALYSTVRGA